MSDSVNFKSESFLMLSLSAEGCVEDCWLFVHIRETCLIMMREMYNSVFMFGAFKKNKN